MSKIYDDELRQMPMASAMRHNYQLAVMRTTLRNISDSLNDPKIRKEESEYWWWRCPLAHKDITVAQRNEIKELLKPYGYDRIEFESDYVTIRIHKRADDNDV